MKRSIFIALLLCLSSVASADLPCRSGGEVATSTNGVVRVVSSAYGCRNMPMRHFTIEGPRTYQLEGIHGHERAFVSDTGRTVILAIDERPRADRGEIVVYRDGRQLGRFTLAQILGAQHRSVREGLYVRPRVEGVHFVIDDLRGRTLFRSHLGMFHADGSLLV